MGDEKVVVSDADIQKVEQQVKAAEQSEQAKIEERVRRELTTEAKARELESKLAEQQKMASEAQAEAARARAEAEALIKAQAEQRIQQEAARSKQPVNSTNPFKGGETRPTISQEDIPGIDRASYEAMREKFKR